MKRYIKTATHFAIEARILVFAIFLLIVGCKIEEGISVPFWETTAFDGDASCLFKSKQPSDPLVIRSQTELDFFQDCFFEKPVLFDFEQHTLVGIWIRGGGCDFPRFRIDDVRKDQATQAVTIDLQVDEVGNCLVAFEGVYWIEIKALPKDNRVIIDLE